MPTRSPSVKLLCQMFQFTAETSLELRRGVEIIALDVLWTPLIVPCPFQVVPHPPVRPASIILVP